MAANNINECQEHSGLVHDLDASKKDREHLTRLVENLQTTKASSRQMWQILSIYLVISMAVVGWLWHTQSSMGEKIMVQLKEDTQKREQISEGIAAIKGRVEMIDWKFQLHIEQGKDTKK